MGMTRWTSACSMQSATRARSAALPSCSRPLSMRYLRPRPLAGTSVIWTLSAGIAASSGVGREALGAGCGGLSGLAPGGVGVRAFRRVVFDRFGCLGASGLGGLLAGPRQRTLIAIHPKRTGSQGRPVRAERSEPRSGVLDGRERRLGATELRACCVFRRWRSRDRSPVRSQSRLAAWVMLYAS